ncbi:hypothetical protein M433DRAFT_151325 [Acidomyces richmondensis BFW]|nr:MAG: hypothetical protein FE78DRAFT_92134 [Acidomyces sp. 'richmondensis']KYG48196.1 hypothetical protein M433DRAFT_151325 [Acidomyces richmondensis BFW]
MQRIRDTATDHDINIALGFSERDGNSVYIAQALISSTGEIEMKRRKMKPTHMEQTIFGDASGSCLADVVALPESGTKVGGLSCREHIQPLLKYFTFSQGEQVHVAAWPPLDTFIQDSPGFFSMSAEGCLCLSQAYAIEAQAFVLHCVAVITNAGIELMKTTGSPIMGTPTKGSSAVVGPDGRILSASDTRGEELIIADLDMSQIIKTKTFADASGHYSRPDMLWLGADPTTKSVVRILK